MGVVCTAEREVGGSGKEYNYSKAAVKSAATQGAYYNVIRNGLGVGVTAISTCYYVI